ncbi:hypothetical protein AB0M34_28105 [Nocardia sp. NPDC050193]
MTAALLTGLLHDQVTVSPIHAAAPYYNRFLTHRLPNPLTDAKQMVLFQNVPVRDTDTLQRALGTLQTICSKPALARLHTAIHWRGR